MYDFSCLGEGRIRDFGPFAQIGWPKLEQMNALPLHFLMLIFAGWVNRHQQDVIEYLVVCQNSADRNSKRIRPFASLAMRHRSVDFCPAPRD
jgi:hypothetical protein